MDTAETPSYPQAEYDTLQRRLIEEIARSIYKAVGDAGDPVHAFGEIAIDLLRRVNGEPVPAGSRYGELIQDYVDRPIARFLGLREAGERSAEMRYLRYLVLDRVLSWVGSEVNTAYHTEAHARRRRQRAH